MRTAHRQVRAAAPNAYPPAPVSVCCPARGRTAWSPWVIRFDAYQSCAVVTGLAEHAAELLVVVTYDVVDVVSRVMGWPPRAEWARRAL